MALGEWQIFSWKSKKTQVAEAEQYERWAFPFGQPQQDKLEKLLLELFPKESKATTLIPYLTCKELFDDALKVSGQREVAAAKLIGGMKKYKRIIRKKDMPMFVAVVMADRQVSETLDYPAADDIRAHAAELEKLRED